MKNLKKIVTVVVVIVAFAVIGISLFKKDVPVPNTPSPETKVVSPHIAPCEGRCDKEKGA